jgi:hypothetical protein
MHVSCHRSDSSTSSDDRHGRRGHSTNQSNRSVTPIRWAGGNRYGTDEVMMLARKRQPVKSLAMAQTRGCGNISGQDFAHAADL